MKIPPLFTVILLACTPMASWAQGPTGSPSASPAEVAARLSQLEAETQSLRAEVQWMREHPVRLPALNATPTGMASELAASEAAPAGSNSPAPAPAVDPVPSSPPAPAAGRDEYFTLEELQGEMKKFSWKKGDFAIVPYGFLWGNTVYSTERTFPGTYTLWVQSPTTTQAENECIVDVRNTRLGFDVTGPRIPFFNCAQSGGKVEIDFQNNTLNVLSGENKSTVMLRHAYFDVKDDEFRLLVGQTWDVISPLNPGMLLYSVGWDGGNIGYRRAQFRGERYLTLSDTSLVTAQLSINPQVFVDNISTKAPAPVGTLTGEPSNWPVVEGRVGWTIGERGQGCLPITVGLSGHIGKQEFDYAGTPIINPSISNVRRRTWSGNVDVRVPLSERLGFQGECYVGENLGTFLGGIGQGVDPVGLNSIRDAGGWLELWYDWTPRLHSHVGYSLDDPDNNDIHIASGRTYNQFYFGNLIFDVTKNFILGMEVSSWKTLYLGQLPGDSVRCEFVAKYGF